METNFSYLPLYQRFSFPAVQTFQVPAFYCIEPPSNLIPSQEDKKYKRTWTKLEVEQAFNATINYCHQACKSIDSLELGDFATISLGLRQSPEQIMIKIKEIKANGTLRPGKWSKTEDELLTDLISKTNQGWGHIAHILNVEVHNKLSIRNSKACKERWNNYLNPSINRGPWSREEDCMLLKQYLLFGNKWKTISQHLPCRIEGAVKNRTKSLLHKIKQSCRTNEDLPLKIQEFCDKTENLL